MGSTLEKIEQLELRLETVKIQLEVLAKILDEFEAKAQELLDRDV